MRRVPQNRPLSTAPIDHEHARELEHISRILDANPEIQTWVENDIVDTGISRLVGRPGLTADQTLRALVVKQMNGFTYDELAFHLADSATYRRFCRIGAFDKGPKKSCLQKNIKRIRAETLEWINQLAVLGEAQKDGIETGRKVRIDCTAVETNILEPSDSGLLWDSVRVLARNLERCKEFGIIYPDHTRVSKNTAYELRTLRRAKATKRKKLYRKLIRHTVNTIAYAEATVDALGKLEDLGPLESLIVAGLEEELRHFIPLARQVVNQTRRRVMDGEKVPAREKIVSIFEPHTDIIVKGGRKTEFGHKIVVSGGPSGIITDCVILDGNPADSTLAVKMVKRQLVRYGRTPLQVVFDGGFAAKANLSAIKDLDVSDVVFSKRRGMEISEMARSTWVYKRLVRFRAGIEAGISFLKRCFGLTRCTWKGLRSFNAYTWASVLTANLLTLARHRMPVPS